MKSQANVYKWSTIDRLCNVVITFGGNIVLSRILSQDDFGLLAMVAIFSAIAYNLASCGMSDGLIKKLHPTREDYSTVFTFNVAAGVFFCLLFISFSRPIANFFEQPELVKIMWAIGICFVFQTMMYVQETKLRKHLEMKKVAIVRLSASASAVGLGIGLALAGYGYWGLVSSRIFLSVFLFIYYVIATRWMPRLGMYRKSFKEMFGFGFNLMLTYVMGQVSRNINTFVLGKFSSSDSGVYSQAQKMEEVPYTMLDTVLNSSFFAIISNEENAEKRHRLSLQTLSWMITISVTLGLILTLLAKPGFHLLFTDKWDASIPVFRVLIIFSIAATIKYYFQAVMKIYGMTRKILFFTVIEVVVQLTLLFIFYRYGMIVIAWTQVTGCVLVLWLYAHCYCRIEKISFGRMFHMAVRDLSIPFAAFAVTGVGYWVWDGALNAFFSCVLTLACFTAFALLLWELHPNALYLRYRSMAIAKLQSLRPHR